MSPRNAFIELTKHCNLACVHCYVVDNTHRNELSTDEVKRLLDDLAREGFLFLTLTGGEVLLRRDFFELAWHAKRLRFAVTVFTNGTLVTDEIADQFAELSPYLFEISLHGATPETCDAATAVDGSYAQILAGVRRLRARGLPVRLKANVLDINTGDVHRVARLAKELGVSFSSSIRPSFRAFPASRMR